jgi:hypothetical protein
MAYVYQHVRLDTNEVFYIGIAKNSLNNYRRAKLKVRRNVFWQNIINKTEYRVDILFDNISWEEACEKEKELILKFGKRIDNTGTLVNITNGGEGSIGLKRTKEEIKKFTEFAKQPLTEKHKLNIKLSKLGTKHSEETKKKISESNKGKHKASENFLYSKRKYTDEEIIFMRESVKNKTKTRKELIFQFNISEQALCDIIKGRRYKNIPL